ncbi:MAG TPA: ATP-binding cassette domain-containing protein [Candidatus Hydrogenedentes bacterium]|jgi:oligopeptide/dipeptide ABC transporter ATP-binding protein|nr:MAG: Glutathione import ATP-binding protein GsiA [Candidatus Hydrogenedentes bacterium ADurb.Bin170]HOD94868.1 ATP-binding cassette domain-containing protein [Candidatus Hydrogenedentota bacterium]HOR50312.1 ATP-binding cassette domain-containing protein [Candidatus Hydrogenedentota bacterium]HPK25529.1 ATP-binding cassette domain-containing protein [Candidatus Hydrogenedentota bacterium]HPX87076.1 ATP-binding cassette domain-containing protein [Candidatus Hydrogenedentota bacterium]
MAPLISVQGLIKHFPIRTGVLSRVTGAVHAVNNISFSIDRGTTLSLVGESGSGKTTAGRCLLRLIEPDAGQVYFDGEDVLRADSARMRELRKRMQIIFQDPFGSLNPRMTVHAMLREMLLFHGIVPRSGLNRQIALLLDRVGLPASAGDRYPHEFSGGQRQRLGIARALAVEPEFIVADEPVSALDVSIQAQILNLLQDLQESLGITFLFIGHNLDVVRHISTHVAVMYLGHIVETAPVSALFEDPVHPYTLSLLAAVPVAKVTKEKRRIIIPGEVPSPINPPSGCPFHPRCPLAEEECKTRKQHLEPLSPEHQVACAVQMRKRAN